MSAYPGVSQTPRRRPNAPTSDPLITNPGAPAAGPGAPPQTVPQRPAPPSGNSGACGGGNKTGAASPRISPVDPASASGGGANGGMCDDQKQQPSASGGGGSEFLTALQNMNKPAQSPTSGGFAAGGYGAQNVPGAPKDMFFGAFPGVNQYGPQAGGPPSSPVAPPQSGGGGW